MHGPYTAVLQPEPDRFPLSSREKAFRMEALLRIRLEDKGITPKLRGRSLRQFRSGNGPAGSRFPPLPCPEPCGPAEERAKQKRPRRSGSGYGCVFTGPFRRSPHWRSRCGHPFPYSPSGLPFPSAGPRSFPRRRPPSVPHRRCRDRDR